MPHQPPFGSPDGSQLADDQLLGLHPQALASIVEGLESRLLIGRPGVGKTCLLREAEKRLAAAGVSGLADGIQGSGPRTSTVRRVEELVPHAGELTEAWEEIWRAALFRSLASKLKCSGDVSLEAEFRFRHGDLTRRAAECRVPVAVVSQVDEIVAEADSRDSLDRYLHNDEWQGFESALAVTLKDGPPWWILLDLSNVNLAQVPGAWFAAQHGLLRTIVHLRRGPTRECFKVLAATRGAHYTQYRQANEASSVQGAALVIDVDEHGAAAFCESKLALISDASLSRPGAQGITKLLGRDIVINAERVCEEPAMTYLVRHTRSTPRDVVIVGNKLAAALPSTGTTRGRSLSSDRIRQVISYCARFYGSEQLLLCAQQLAASLAPADSVHEYFISATSSPAGSLRSQLGTFIGAIGRDRFTPEELKRARESRGYEFPGDVADTLWQNGLIGCVDPAARNGQAAFFSLEHSSNDIPRPRGYVFHPCLIDVLDLAHDGARSDPILPTMEQA